MSAMTDRIRDLFGERGRAAYLGEAVTQEEHALQAAWAAEKDGAAASLIAAALLHDVGHLLHDLDYAAERGVDDCHEERGRLWLEEHFPPEVCEPVRLHVAAKRYLCAAEAGYFEGLSPASVLSLDLQGGPMTEEEATAFRAGPFAAAAVALRRWDEEAKIPGLATPPLEHFMPYLESAARV
jgi:gamma-butyrobetaine dioxygenase